MKRTLVILGAALLILAIDLFYMSHALADASVDPLPPPTFESHVVQPVAHLPPRFVPGTFLYVDGRLVKILLGTSMFLRQQECMKDVQASVEKALASGSRKVIGYCLPVPTLSVEDLTATVESERGTL